MPIESLTRKAAAQAIVDAQESARIVKLALDAEVARRVYAERSCEVMRAALRKVHDACESRAGWPSQPVEAAVKAAMSVEAERRHTLKEEGIR